MTTKLKLGTDVNGKITYALPWTSLQASSKLTDSTEETLTVPENVNVAFFTFTDGYDVYAQRNGATITLPGSGFTFVENKCLKPGARYEVTGGDTLRFICNTGGDDVNVSVEFFNLSQGVI